MNRGNVAVAGFLYQSFRRCPDDRIHQTLFDLLSVLQEYQLHHVSPWLSIFIMRSPRSRLLGCTDICGDIRAVRHVSFPLNGQYEHSPPIQFSDVREERVML